MRISRLLLCLAGLAFPAAAAENSADQALTPIGAERAGNAEGTIPAWDGGLERPPSAYQPGQHHPDPYPDDEVLFTIERSNLQQHQDRLTPGQRAMFAKYASFRMPVYPSRRSAAYPERIYAATRRNAGRARLTGGGNGVSGSAEGFPFPLPANGAEAMWNHKLRYRGSAVRRYNTQVAPTAGGQYTAVRIREQLLGPYWQAGSTLQDIGNVLLYQHYFVEAPARLAGQVLLVHESLDQTAGPRQAWVYNPAQRRVRKAPDVAYDNPGTATEGLRTSDMNDMFNGPLDRYDWTLAGKQELYVNYNAYRIHAGGLALDQLVRPGHLNPDLQRYELHRVWKVEATVKPGLRHLNPRRSYYLDEDSWQVLAIDHYDGAGKLWRYSEAAALQYYELPALWTTLETHHDLHSGRYVASGLDNGEAAPDFSFQAAPDDYAPQKLRASGTR